MKPSGVLTAIVAVPVLALFLGVGILAWRIGETWTEVQTSALVTSAAMICGGGAMLAALLVALIVGIPLATRFFHEAGMSRQTWDQGQQVHYHALPAPGQGPRGYQEPRAPMLEDRQGGAWQSSGPAGYDLGWDDDDTIEIQRQWDGLEGPGRRG